MFCLGNDYNTLCVNSFTHLISSKYTKLEETIYPRYDP